ncbi:hypothetical protein AB0C77_35355 [Streptomyces sp. NPDC048629]
MTDVVVPAEEVIEADARHARAMEQLEAGLAALREAVCDARRLLRES